MQTFDLVVIGGGSAGLKAARTAARQGRRVALAEERELGGECFWAGCVPTKAMVRAAEVWHLVGRAHEFGIHTQVIKADFADAMRYKDGVVKTISGEGPEDAGLSKLGASYFPTRASFESAHEIRVGNEVIRTEKVLIATGTVPHIPDVPGLREAGFITNREAVHLTTLPKRLAVMGGGPIGLEFAQLFRRFGAEVTVLDHGERLLSKEDADISALATQFLREEGIVVHNGTRVTEVETLEDGTKRLRFNNETPPLDCDEILVATGRRAAITGMNLEAADIVHDARHIPVDPYLRTNQPHIFAAGDITGGYLFTHVASYEGGLAAHNLFSGTLIPFDHRVVPRCTYIDPEVASIGVTEATAKAQNLPYTVLKYSFADLDRAILYGDARGLVKILVDELNGRILGAHLIGPQASSVLAELAVAMRNHLPITAIAETMHAYPSFPEAVEAAALSARNFRGQVDGAMG
ncbi:MAG: NAD(P)/FAD-dependent oxidoreductase [Chthonomonadaceae bacterium]|nr:NAD(P)/FAD-dependent oxidoreductase [Chthonomonadaceae bacterium]